jgi:hypothetical protein
MKNLDVFAIHSTNLLYLSHRVNFKSNTVSRWMTRYNETNDLLVRDIIFLAFFMSHRLSEQCSNHSYCSNATHNYTRDTFCIHEMLLILSVHSGEDIEDSKTLTLTLARSMRSILGLVHNTL